ncbi:MAG: phosphoribosyltransferase family protein [Chloroflexota bacterium]
MAEVPPTLELIWDKNDVHNAIVKLAAQLASDLSSYQSVNLVPVLTGGMIFSAQLAIELENLSPGKWSIAPVFCSSYEGDHNIKTPRIDFPDKFRQTVDFSCPTVIIDDLLDTGNSLEALRKLLGEMGAPQVYLCVLVDKPLGRSTPLSPDYSGLVSTTNDWLVGYGMDTNLRYRALDAIYAYQRPTAEDDPKA